MNPVPVIDLHEDISLYFLRGACQPLADFSEDVPDRGADIPKYRKGNVRIIFASIFPAIKSFDPEASKKLKKLYGKWLPVTVMRLPQIQVLEHFKIYYKLAKTYNIRVVENSQDLNEVMDKEYALGIIIHLEGAEAIDEPYDLVLLRKLGLRSLGITWNFNNKYGAACASKKDYGLTPDGEELIRVANKLGIIVDLAHASKRTALEAIEISKKPIIISHTNIRRFVDNPRNIDDEILEAIHKNKGVVGMSLIRSLIASKKEPTIDDLVQHFMYIYERFGASIIGVGTDFHGLPRGLSLKGFETIDKVQILLSKLQEKGLGSSDLEKIAYGNALRILKEHLK